MDEEFYRRDLSGARFEDVDFVGSWFRNVTFRQARLLGVWLEDVEIDGYVERVSVNGVDIGPLVEAELVRRDPDRALVRARDVDGIRAGWASVERRWAETVERARSLPEDLLHERVREEWSFIETQRHLVFVTDAWLSRALLGDPYPYHRLGLPTSDLSDLPDVPHDAAARPGLDEVLAVRESRFAAVRAVLAGLTAEQLEEHVAPVHEPGYPGPEDRVVGDILRTILGEEYFHREYAERDLAVLRERAQAPG